MVFGWEGRWRRGGGAKVYSKRLMGGKSEMDVGDGEAPSHYHGECCKYRAIEQDFKAAK